MPYMVQTFRTYSDKLDTLYTKIENQEKKIEEDVERNCSTACLVNSVPNGGRHHTYTYNMIQGCAQFADTSINGIVNLSRTQLHTWTETMTSRLRTWFG